MNGTAGIYKISTITGDVYIGQTSNVGGRWRRHLSKLTSKCGNRTLQRVYDEHGATAFTFNILEVIDGAKAYDPRLLERERYWQSVTPGCLGKVSAPPQVRKLNADQVRTIRVRRAAGESPTTIGQDYGISHTLVSFICTGKRYSDIV